jgi:hypothetical protein
MTTTPRRFLIEDCDGHDGSRVVVCTINVHIVYLVESVVRDGPQQKATTVCSETDCAEVRLANVGWPRVGASGLRWL